MGDYSPQLGLGPRADEVSSAIAVQMDRTRHSCVYLDLSHLELLPELRRASGCPPHRQGVCRVRPATSRAT
jgi:aspartate oxidase